MTKEKDLSRLSDLAQLMLEHRLGRLRNTVDLLDQSRMQLSALDQTSQPADLALIAAARVELDYDRWADTRRAELNLVIARQTAAWLEARGEAQHAYGRVQALKGLAAKRSRTR